MEMWKSHVKIKKSFKKYNTYGIMTKVMNNKGGLRDEAYQNPEYRETAEHIEEGRMRRVPDILPVCLQDFLHSRKSELRE